MAARALVAPFLLTLAAACGHSGDGGGGGGGGGGSGAPGVPAATTMSVDLSLTDTALNLDDPSGFAALPSTNYGPAINYAQATAVVLNVSGNVAEPLALPVAALRAAAGKPSQLQAESTWAWSYDFDYEGRSYTGNLLGKRVASSRIAWSLRLTSRSRDPNGCCDAFEIASGESSEPNAGTWQIYDPTHPAKPARLVSVSYDTRDARSLRFEVNSERAPALRFGRGSTVVYKVAGDELTLTINDSSEPGARSITWDRKTRAGRQKDPQGATTCWDTEANAYANVTCQ
jgi:hypothetical protein